MSDINTYGSAENLGYYWIRRTTSMGPAQSSVLHLVTIDQFGKVTDTGNRRPDDPAALDQGEAVQSHLAAAIKAADDHLERRRAEMPEMPEAKPPHDPATDRFLDDGDY